MGMPSLQEFVAMLDNAGAESRQIARSKSAGAREFDWIEPELRRRVGALDVNMRRLIVLQAVKKNRNAPERRTVGMVASAFRHRAPGS
jgi:hypothetical protein